MRVPKRDDVQDLKEEEVDEALGEMKLEEHALSNAADIVASGASPRTHTPNGFKTSASTSPEPSKSEEQSPAKQESASETPASDDGEGAAVDGDIMATAEAADALKQSRKASRKAASHAPRLFDHLQDVTEEATSGFQIIKDCIYGSKYMGYSEHDALDCDCSEEWSEYVRQSQRAAC
jgi:histone-lysine N-methyltransferase SETD2